MESKAVITESGAESYTDRTTLLTDDLAAHAAKGLEAHSDSRLLVGTPYLDDAGIVVSPDTFRFRTVDSTDAIILIDVPVILFSGQAVENIETAPPPPVLPPAPAPAEQAVVSGGTVSTASGTTTYGSGCFPKLTRIKRPDGTFTRIEELKAGDRLASFDITGLNPSVELAWKSWGTANLKMALAETVVKTLKVDSFNRYYVIKFGDGSTLRVTYEHPVLCLRDWLWRFVPAAELRVSDEVQAVNGKRTIVEKVEITANIITYNLDVEPFDVYIADGILVHNVVIKY